MNVKKIVVAAAVLTVAAGAVLASKRARAVASLAPPAATPLPVTAAAVREGTVAEAVRTVALIQAESATTVAAQVPGILVEVLRREGDRVRAGDRLARIDPRTLDDAVEAARARVAAAAEELAHQQAVHQRNESLFAGNAISRQALDASRAQLEAARAAEITAQRGLETSRTARSYAEVVAPYAGVVAGRLVEPGDLAMPGKPLFTLQVTGKVRLLSKLSQSSLAGVAVGTAVTFSSGDRTITGRVTRVYPALDVSRLGSVESVLPEAPFGLPPGAVVGATYDAHPVRGLVVPSLALLDGLHEMLVVRVDEGRADPVPVDVVGRAAREVVVAGALAPGDLVVTGLPSELLALTRGRSVQVATSGAAVAREVRP